MNNLKIKLLILLSVLITVTTPLQAKAEHICEELKASCEETIKQADSIIKRQDELIQFLDTTNNDLLSQVGAQQKEILALQDPPWYSRPITAFLIGIITGGLLNEKLNNR